jgi:hypothetical protein
MAERDAGKVTFDPRAVLDAQTDATMLEVEVVGSYPKDHRECDDAGFKAPYADRYNSEGMDWRVDQKDTSALGELRSVIRLSARDHVEPWLGRCPGSISKYLGRSA